MHMHEALSVLFVSLVMHIILHYVDWPWHLGLRLTLGKLDSLLSTGSCITIIPFKHKWQSVVYKHRQQYSDQSSAVCQSKIQYKSQSTAQSMSPVQSPDIAPTLIWRWEGWRIVITEHWWATFSQALQFDVDERYGAKANVEGSLKA